MDHLIYDALKDLLVKMVASDCLSKSFTANEFVCKAKSFLHDKKSETDIVQIADLLCSNLNSMSEQEWVTMLKHTVFYMDNIKMDTWKPNGFRVVDRRQDLWWV